MIKGGHLTQLKTLLAKIKLWIIHVYSSLPYVKMQLPVGLSEFEAFAARIIKKTGALADIDSMKYVLASFILHLPSGAKDVESHYPDSFFVKVLKRAAAGQVVSQVFQDIKAKQQAAQTAAAQPQPAATATEVVADAPKTEA